MLLNWENDSQYVYIKFLGVANQFLTWLANSANHIFRINLRHAPVQLTLGDLSRCVVMTGVDCQLILNHLTSKDGVKSWKRLPALPQVG